MVVALMDASAQTGEFGVWEGEIAGELFVVLRGVCEILVEFNKLPGHRFKQGTCLGEIGLIRDGAKRNAWGWAQRCERG